VDKVSAGMTGGPMPVPVGDAGATDITHLARQLFQWARREPKMKIIPAVERELVIQALKETEGNQVHCGQAAGHNPRHLAQAGREVRDSARVEHQVIEPSLLLLIPAYNEEARIEPVLREYAQYFQDHYQAKFFPGRCP
jgi:hypothetical protein